jgi:hypothetical protein
LNKTGLAGILLATLSAVILFAIILSAPFSTSQLAAQSGRFTNVTGSNPDLGQETNFMWTNLGVALAGQAFVIFAAAAGCLAILRMDQEEEQKE